ncbi:PAS domain-containing protein [Dongia mobilis]|uniref:PAS domain-containing protein n=1 Tax=Dongia mobilis TaxID=578943 RepID=A0A4R6WV15_9PROT|nr:PAS domain-containing protein [Dongia mobilis]TDQ84269.1 PAS domain-containing protein [Dongia mobilis]
MSTPFRRITDDSFLTLCSAKVRRAYDYWNAKRGTRLMPSRADIDPSEIRDLLPGIILIDVAQDPLRLTYRLVGTDEVEARGYDPTGKDVREHVFAVTPEEGFRTYRTVVEMRRPIYDQEEVLAPNPRLSEVGSLAMPLSSDGETVNMLFAFVDYRRNR